MHRFRIMRMMTEIYKYLHINVDIDDIDGQEPTLKRNSIISVINFLQIKNRKRMLYHTEFYLYLTTSLFKEMASRYFFSA